MPDPQDPKDLDVATRERLGELTLALAEDVFALRDPHLDAIMRDLMLQVGRVIARNLEDP
ncbi:hypothetical protein FV218_12520 [Methylobacterium sp. WL69]|uniref:hypothetical protein n=1 Tax=Methylobacterium sp. WL69 TaxID=2603893 RepID=UPI0011C8562D|nr:hypothetical protein [Methylobacterium sp. WL69]TXM72823.1 hypothetical protein FV218_12520 [Methylobacterium sp. WL69]